MELSVVQSRVLTFDPELVGIHQKVPKSKQKRPLMDLMKEKRCPGLHLYALEKYFISFYQDTILILQNAQL